MTLDIITFFIYFLILFLIAFIIAFPIISFWYLLKMRKIKQNIPKDLKGGSLDNGKRKIEEKDVSRRIEEFRGGGYGRGRGSNFREPINKRGYPEFKSENGGKELQRTGFDGTTSYSSNTDKRDTKKDWADFS